MPSGTYPRTLPVLFDRAFATHGDQPAVSDARETLSFRDIDDAARGLAMALVERGVTPGDRVAVLLPNQVAVPVVDIAIMRAGGVRLPLNTMQSQDELAYVFEDAAVSAVVCGEAQMADVASIAPNIEAKIGITDTNTTVETGFEVYDDVVTGGMPDSRLPTVEPGNLAGHYYTGGTTGRPKGVLYSHECLVNALLAHLAEFGFDERDVGVLTAPLSHSAGTFLWTNLIAGAHVHVRDGFDPKQLCTTVDREAATWTFLVPTMVYRLLDSGALDDVGLSSLERILYGAAPMRPDRLREAIDRIGPIFEQFYGQTEVPNLITTMSRAAHERGPEHEDGDRLASAGTACLQSTVQIVDETGDELPPDSVGEVVVTAPYTFDGYYENPEATRRTIRDGWVWTGDVGYLDEAGFLHLLDRKGNVIVSGGMNVYSAEVERVIGEHPGVDAVLVVGVPDADWGEAVHAVVVSTDDESITADDILAFAGDHLAAYKEPKTVEFVDALPTTPLGKLDRSRLREAYWNDEDRHVG